MPCIFCDIEPEKIIAQNELAVAVKDGFPVSPGHVLVIPRRHVGTWFEATGEERKSIFELVDQVYGFLSCFVYPPPLASELQAGGPATSTMAKPDGYNIGFNVGEAAGQTVMHLHVHIIPRFKGDVDDPTGGVRNVIPGKGNYRK
jgi:diadenosine tetraphosphate (Ap4A) HIT family hydrolase